MHLLNDQELQFITKLEDAMKSFHTVDNFNLFSIDITRIMKEGNVQKFNKCICHVLNCKFISHRLCNNSTDFDDSYIEIFQTAQLIIRFLLHLKSNLLVENSKLNRRLVKFEQENINLKKEVAKLKKQLQESVSTNFIENVHCEVTSHTKNVEIGNMYEEVSKLKKIVEGSPTKILKMKITPESSCLETQELYWKGKLKKHEDLHTQEKLNLSVKMNDLEKLNKTLIEELEFFKQKPATTSVMIQTENPLEISDNFLQETIEWSRKRHTSPISNTVSDAISLNGESPTLLKENNYFDETQSVLDRVGNVINQYEQDTEIEEVSLNSSRWSYDEQREEMRKTISKLFTSDNKSDELADKLLKIYDKRTILIPNDEYTSMDERNKIENIDEKNVCRNEPSLEKIDVDNCEIPNTLTLTVPEYSSNNVQKIEKSKSKLLPFLKNIPSKVKKSYTKSRKTCATMIENKICFQNTPSKVENKAFNEANSFAEKKVHDLLPPVKSEKMNHDASKTFVYDREKGPELISAMKKAESTGNITKKVAFSDNLPSIRTVSESNLLNAIGIKQFNKSHEFITIADVHNSNTTLKPVPVPAPRTKKNI